MKRVLLADDHTMMLDGLVRVLEGEFDVCGRVSNGRSLLAEAQRLKPELVLADVSMPELNGIEAVRRLVRMLPGTKVVFVTQQLDPAYIRAAFEAGAMGYVAKQAAGSELREAMRRVLDGQSYVTTLATEAQPSERAATPVPSTEMPRCRLTPRQRDVLQLIAEGKTAKEISGALHISPKTVEFHRNALSTGLGLRTTAELTRYAMRNGLLRTAGSL